MNKYQEALDSLYNDDVFDKNVWNFVYDGDNLSCSDVEKAKKFYKDTLQELVDKATPKKPTKEYIVDGTYYICPCCGYIIEDYSNMQDKDLKKYVIEIAQYCETCGQKLDWRD